jgi:hypothetical protein
MQKHEGERPPDPANNNRPLRNLPEGVREASIFGDYPSRGPRFWLFVAVVVAVGLIGVVLMLLTATKG